MKKLLSVLFLSTAGLSVFGQGKVLFVNDASRLFVLTDTHPADAGLGGGVSTPGISTGAIPASPLPSGITLGASLYAGASLDSMSVQTVIPLTGLNVLAPGRMAPRPMTLSGIPGGVPQFFNIFVYDLAFADPFEARLNGSYWGSSGVFTAIPNTSLFFANLVPDPRSQSTWLPGNLLVGIPEPSAFVLVGVAITLLARRRK